MSVLYFNVETKCQILSSYLISYFECCQCIIIIWVLIGIGIDSKANGSGNVGGKWQSTKC